MAALTTVLTVDGSAAARAAERLSNLVIGPAPSRTNPGGGRTKVLDPRAALAAALPRVVDFCIGRIRAYTPSTSGKVRASYNVRRGFGSGASKGSFDFAGFEIASDLAAAEQVVVNTLENGSRPHVVRARAGKFMRIPLDPADVPAEDAPRGPSRGGGYAFIKREAGGAFLFATSIQHPGTQPHAMFRRTLADSARFAEGVARDVVASVTATWSDDSVNAVASGIASRFPRS